MAVGKQKSKIIKKANEKYEFIGKDSHLNLPSYLQHKQYLFKSSFR